MRKIVKIEQTVPTLPRKKRVAAYARVSMETDRLMHSLTAQISHYSELIQKNPAWEYAGVYADNFVSGTDTKKRDNFRRMIADCEAGHIDIILCKSISRFTRNTVDLLETVRHLKELGIEVRFEKEKINSLSGDGELMLTILASFAQEESRSLSENVKWAIRKGYEQGKVRNTICYGYRLIDGKFQIEPSEAEIVKQIFQMYLSGDSCYAIAEKLNAANVQSYYGKKFSTGVINGIIRQEKYTGNTLIHLMEISSLCGSHRAVLIACGCDWTEVSLSSPVSSPTLVADQRSVSCLYRSSFRSHGGHHIWLPRFYTDRVINVFPMLYIQFSRFLKGFISPFTCIGVDVRVLIPINFSFNQKFVKSA